MLLTLILTGANFCSNQLLPEILRVGVAAVSAQGQELLRTDGPCGLGAAGFVGTAPSQRLRNQEVSARAAGVPCLIETSHH